MKRILSGILALSIISGMSGLQNACALENIKLPVQKFDESVPSNSEITISDVVAPSGRLEKGEAFGLRGIISSEYNLKLVEVKIYLRNSDSVIQKASASPDSTSFNLHPDIDYAIPFGSLDNGRYTYIINAEDINGYRVTLLESDFQVGDVYDMPGDANFDQKIDSADVVIVASYVGNPDKNPVDKQAIINADVHNSGDGLTAGDALMIQQYLAKIITSLENKNPEVTTTLSSSTNTSTTTTTTTTIITESTQTSEIPEGLPEFISDSYYKCCDTYLSDNELSEIIAEIKSGESSIEELMLNLTGYKFSNKQGENSDYIKCLYNSMLKREPSESEINNRVLQLETGKSRFAIFLEVSKSTEFNGICQKYNINGYRADLSNISDTVRLKASHSIYESNSQSSSELGTAYENQILSVCGFKGSWLEVNFLDGKGYIKSEYVSPYGNSLTKVLPVSNIPQNSYIGGSPLPTGCEVTSLSVLMNYLNFSDSGKNYLADAFMPKGNIGSTDPNYAFIGTPESSSSYGAYANAIVRTANNYLSAYEINNYSVQDITGASLDDLYSQIDSGNPVLVWITMNCTATRNYGATWTLQRGTYYTEPGTGTYSFTWKRNEHCCVLAGYNKSKGTVILADVLEGDALTEYTIPEFESAYRWLGNQAVIIKK